MIYTSYFYQLRNLSKNIIPISICGQPPIWYKGIQYKKLAPKISFFKEWKINKDNDYYIEHFKKEVLDKLNALNVVKELYNLSNGKDIVLICFESPDKFCHRHLVSDWLNKEGNIKCEELNLIINKII